VYEAAAGGSFKQTAHPLKLSIQVPSRLCAHGVGSSRGEEFRRLCVSSLLMAFFPLFWLSLWLLLLSPLLLQYDEYDNAAHCMMAHSPVAWEHVTFKDVVIKVSNVDVYYKAIRFYLQVRLGGEAGGGGKRVLCAFWGGGRGQKARQHGAGAEGGRAGQGKARQREKALRAGGECREGWDRTGLGQRVAGQGRGSKP